MEKGVKFERSQPHPPGCAVNDETFSIHEPSSNGYGASFPLKGTAWKSVTHPRKSTSALMLMCVLSDLMLYNYICSHNLGIL